MTDDEIRALLDAATLPDVDYSTLRAEVDRQTYPPAARLFMRHHVAHKKEKLVSVLAMQPADMSLRECEGIPHLFAAAPALANAALEARAKVAELEAAWRSADAEIEFRTAKWAQSEAEAAALRDRLAVLDGALKQIVEWSKAYPTEFFPEPDFRLVAAVLSAAGLSLDTVSASNMRHAIKGCGDIARAALQSTAQKEQSE